MLKKNLIANYLGQGWVAIMNLAFIPIYIKYLGIESYGLIGLFAVLQAWLSLLDMGMAPTLGREMARFTGGNRSNESMRDLLRSIEIIAVCVAVLMATGIALSANWIATDWLSTYNLSTDAVVQAFVIMGLVTALRFVEGIYRSTMIGLQRQVLFNIIYGLIASLRGFGSVGILIWVAPTIEAFFLWQCLVSIAALAILVITTYHCIPKSERSGRFSMNALRGVWRFAGGMMGITLLTLLLTQVDKVLLSKLLKLSEYGYFTLAATVASALYMLISPITQAYYPKFCQLHAQGNAAHLAKSYHQGAQLVSIVAGSAAIVLFFFAETLLRLWTQDAEISERVAPLLSLLALGTLLNGLMWIPYQTQLAYGWTRLAILTNVVAVTLLVPAMLWAVPRYGAIGAAWIWIILNSGYCLISAQVMYQRILQQEKWRWYLRDVMAPLAAALLAAKSLHWLWPIWYGNMADLTLIAMATFLTPSAALLGATEIRQSVLDLLKRQSLTF